MASEGKLSRWDDERGFGFITPTEGGKDVFVHIKAFPTGQRPQVGDWLRYQVTDDSRFDGRQRAARIERHWSAKSAKLAKRSRKRKGTEWGGASLLAIPLFIALLGALVFFWKIPKLWGGVYVAASLCCFLVYLWDKQAARADRRRVPESTLHVWSLLGGWPGALLAQQYLRHKSVKASFRAVFWLTVAVNVAGFVWLASPDGRAWLQATPIGTILG